jgi:hypothetical protein
MCSGNTNFRRAEHLLLDISGPRGVFVLVFEGLGPEDPKELERQVDWPAPLPWCHPYLCLGELPGEGPDEDLVLVREGRQHDVLHWRVQLLEQLHPTQLQDNNMRGIKWEEKQEDG